MAVVVLPEIGLNKINGDNAFSILKKFNIGAIKFERNEIIPDLFNISTDIIKAKSVGKRLITIFSPSKTPLKKSSITFFFSIIPINIVNNRKNNTAVLLKKTINFNFTIIPSLPLFGHVYERHESVEQIGTLLNYIIKFKIIKLRLIYVFHFSDLSHKKTHIIYKLYEIFF